MRLLVLQHCPVTPVGLVGECAVERDAELVTLFPHDGDRVPATMAGFGGLIVLGGPMHAGDDEGYPAFASILSLIRKAGKPGCRCWAFVLALSSLRALLGSGSTGLAGWKSAIPLYI